MTRNNRSSPLSIHIFAGVEKIRFGFRRKELGEPPHQFVPLRDHTHGEEKYERFELTF